MVTNGGEAVAATESQRFDVILMDVQMPVMDGIEATRIIRERESRRGYRVPIVAMTAFAMKGDRERLLQAGMDAYISKPLNRRDFLSTVEQQGVGEGGDAPDTAPGPDSLGLGTPGFDAPRFMENVLGDTTLAMELSEAFGNEYPRILLDLRRAAAAGDGPKLAFAAHTIKGMVSTFFAKAAFSTAAQLEQIANSGKLGSAEQLALQLVDEVEVLNQGLCAFLAKQTSI